MKISNNAAVLAHGQAARPAAQAHESKPQMSGDKASFSRPEKIAAGVGAAVGAAAAVPVAFTGGAFAAAELTGGALVGAMAITGGAALAIVGAGAAVGLGVGWVVDKAEHHQ